MEGDSKSDRSFILVRVSLNLVGRTKKWKFYTWYEFRSMVFGKCWDNEMYAEYGG